MTAIAQPMPMALKPARKRSPFAISWWKALLVTLPMALLTGMMLMGSMGDPTLVPPALLISVVTVWLALNVAFYLMLYTGQTFRFRSVLFVVVALSFVLTFIPSLLEIRGNVALTEANFIDGETPFCHLVIPMVILPAALTKTIIFPGSIVGPYGIASMLVLWAGSSLALGRGWCSWVCFYGGLDEGFSRLLKKPRIKNIDRKWTYLPLAVLIGVVLISAITLSPTYCEWLCPFKAVTEFEAVTSFRVLVQTIIFVSLFVGFVVVLPLLTKKRAQCGMLCPLGVVQGWTNHLNVYDIRIDPAKCSQCGHCTTHCPTFSLDESSYQSGKPLTSCTKCGQCVDICPKKAISFHIKGTSLNHPTLARALFLYPAYVLMVGIGGGMIATALYRLFLLVTTGSMI